MSKDLTFCIVAGEVSGDQLGAGLIAALKLLYPHAKFVGIGGELMRQQGCQTWYDIADLSYFGIVDVVKNLPGILKTIKNTKQLIKQQHCDIYIGIDNPDFNLRVAKYCKQELKIPTVQYVSPSVWAWRQGRVKTIKAAIDLVLCLLPFEPTFYAQHQLPASYVGHRLANSLKHLLALDLISYLSLEQVSGSSHDLSTIQAQLATLGITQNPTYTLNSDLTSTITNKLLTYSKALITNQSNNITGQNNNSSNTNISADSNYNSSKTKYITSGSDTNSGSNDSSEKSSNVNLLQPRYSLEQLTTLLTNSIALDHTDSNHLPSDHIKSSSQSNGTAETTITDVTAITDSQLFSKLSQAITSSSSELTKQLQANQQLWQDIFTPSTNTSNANSNSNSNLELSNDQTQANNDQAQTKQISHDYHHSLESNFNSNLNDSNAISLPSRDEFEQELVTKQLAKYSLNLSDDQFYVAVLPGSRVSEINLILQPFLAGISQAIEQQILPPNTHLLIPIAKPKLIPLITEITAQFPQLSLSLVDKNAHLVLLASSVALVASGTATLDTMLCHIPMIVGYKLSSLNYYLAKKLVKLPYVALSNIVQGQEMSKELIQSDLVPDQICHYLQQILQANYYYSTRLQFFKQHLALVTDSDTLAAQQVQTLLEKHNSNTSTTN